MRKAYQTIYIICILELLLFFIYLFYGNKSKYFFTDPQMSEGLLSFLTAATPIALIGTLFGILKATDNSRVQVIKIVAVVVLAFIVTIGFLGISMVPEPFVVGQQSVLFVNKYDSTWRIAQQLESEDGFSSSGQRIVEIKKFTKWFISCENIDTSMLNRDAWVRSVK